jgi:hypothetical protein
MDIKKTPVAIKYIPKVWRNEKWVCFYFDHWDKHYTIRFRWNPMLVLEYMYKKRSWKNDFKVVYKKAKNWEPDEGHKILRKCTQDITELLEVFDAMAEDDESPLVVYANPWVDIEKITWKKI